MSSEKLLNNLRRLIAELPAAVDRGLTEAAEEGAKLARTQTFYTVRTGTLRDNTKAVDYGFGVKGIVANTFYASWVNFGNAPPGTKIYPKTAKSLRFVIDGEVFYRKWVNASQPKPFWNNMVKWERDNLSQIVARHIFELIGSF